jgi:flagellar assembly protein FliH
MGELRKHAFTTEFAPNGAILRAAPPPLTPEQTDAKCAAAYEQGKADAFAEAERRAAAALENLGAAASMLLNKLESESRAMRTEAAQVALAAARKIAGAALDAFGAERAALALEAAMDALRHQPRLLIKLAPDTAEALKPRIDALCETHAYGGAVLVRPDPDLRAGDISIDWSDGLIHLNAGEVAERIGALIDAALATP